MWVLANTVTVVPFLFACTFLFAVIAYFAIGLHPGATAFFRFLIYLFLGVLAAESQSMLIAAAVPIFVAALALASFLNGFWMCVQGYFISAESLPRFWYYSFHFMVSCPLLLLFPSSSGSRLFNLTDVIAYHCNRIIKLSPSNF